jgi:hypothetical protein
MSAHGCTVALAAGAAGWLASAGVVAAACDADALDWQAASAMSVATDAASGRTRR